MFETDLDSLIEAVETLRHGEITNETAVTFAETLLNLADNDYKTTPEMKDFAAEAFKLMSDTSPFMFEYRNEKLNGWSEYFISVFPLCATEDNGITDTLSEIAEKYDGAFADEISFAERRLDERVFE